MKLTPAHQFAFHLFNAGITNARRDYTQTPTEFTKRVYCRTCSRPPAAHNHCDACDARLRMRRVWGAA